jgi:DNA-binding response OmpR family regulator
LRRVELQRSVAAPPEVGSAVVQAGALRVDPGEHTASIEGQPLELTPKEFDLLTLLVSHPGRAFARDYLLDRVWGAEYGGLETRTVDTHILRLRKKLGSTAPCTASAGSSPYRTWWRSPSRWCP